MAHIACGVNTVVAFGYQSLSSVVDLFVSLVVRDTLKDDEEMRLS